MLNIRKSTPASALKNSLAFVKTGAAAEAAAALAAAPPAPNGC